ncbi:MAG: polymer-forming cytoskeletal protein, partial [Candidatus Aminicenantes bacterium]|nr:polymer-forming cytoskeletal protein [Candidatus Aminicenantes bacterium]
KSGNVTGKIEADVINIIGKAKGDIISRKKLIIQSSANFDGNINTDNVIIEEGGIFNGNMNLSEK